MNIKDIHRVYFVGIGGIGMSAIARWFNAEGYTVAGYDKTPSDITNNLINEGINVSYGDSVNEIETEYLNQNKTTLIIYTPAIPNNHKGLNYFNDNNYTVLKRSEALGLLVSEKLGIAVAGTHGKTSISTTIAWLMNKSCNAFLGGISKNINSNVIINTKAQHVVVEADEFDRSFLTLYPEIAVISSIDADHLDIYNDYKSVNNAFHQFISQIKPEGILIYKLGLNINKNINPKITYYTYSVNENSADFYASNIKIENGYYNFTWHTPTEVISGFKLGAPGLYNLENAISALASARFANTDISVLKENLASYIGVNRRFDYQIKSKSIVFIDDYAHHPKEIKACINSVRHLYPNKSITTIFQPHLFTRTKDFADEFAESLEFSDNIILTDIYPAREEPIPGVDSNLILDKINNTSKIYCSYNKLVNETLKANTDIIITMGAGDIDRLVPKIKKELQKKYLE